MPGAGGIARGLLTISGVGWFVVGLAVVYVILSLVSAIALRLANGWIAATDDLGLPSALRVSFASGLLFAVLGAFAFSGIALMQGSNSNLSQGPLELLGMLLFRVSDVAQTAFFLTLGNAVLFRQMLRGRDGEAMSFATSCALSVLQGAMFSIAWLMIFLGTSVVVVLLMR